MTESPNMAQTSNLLCFFSLNDLVTTRHDAVSQCIEETKLRESFEENTARLSRTLEITS